MNIISSNTLKHLQMDFTEIFLKAHLDTLLHVAGVIGAVVVGREALHHPRARRPQTWPGADVAGDQAQPCGGHGLLHHRDTSRPIEHHWTVAGETSIEIMAWSLKKIEWMLNTINQPMCCHVHNFINQF